MLNQKAIMSFSEEQGPSEERPKMWKEELGFEYGALLGRVFKCLNKLVGSASFYLQCFLPAVPVVARALLYVGVSSYQELMQKGFPDQSSTAVASTLRLPATVVVVVAVVCQGVI
jgi:hypothetical protein